MMLIRYDLSKYENEEDFFDDENFEEVTAREIEDQGRWSTFYSQVFKDKDGNFWQASWERGSTEYQEVDPNLLVVAVEPYEEIVTKYKVLRIEKHS